METSKIIVIAIVCFLFGFPLCKGDSSCSITYQKWGSRTTLSSRKCSEMIMLDKASNEFNHTLNCTYWGTESHERSPDGRLLCYLNLTIPVYGQNGSVHNVGMMTLFGDDRIRKERMEFYSGLTRDFFLTHAYFLQNGTFESHRVPGPDEELVRQISEVMRIGSENSDNKWKMVLKEAVLRSVDDLVLGFEPSGIPNDQVYGCPVIVLVFGGQVLVFSACDAQKNLCGGLAVPQYSLGSVLCEAMPYVCTQYDLDEYDRWAKANWRRIQMKRERVRDSVTYWRSLNDEDQTLLAAPGGVFKWLTRENATCHAWHML